MCNFFHVKNIVLNRTTRIHDAPSDERDTTASQTSLYLYKQCNSSHVSKNVWLASAIPTPLYSHQYSTYQMTHYHYRWILQYFQFHHGSTTCFLLLLLLSPPWVAAQTYNSPPREDPKIRVSPAMTIVIICLMTTFLIMACVSVYIRHCVQRRMAHNFTLESDGVGASRRSRRRPSSRGLDPALIDSFPIFIYSEVSGLKIGKCGLECAVCLNEFEHDETLRLLPNCSHVFHPDCIDTWLSSHITCPVCRANLIPKPDETRGFVLSHDTGSESPHIHDDNLNGVDDNIIVSVHSPEVINPIEMPSRNCSTRSTPRKERVEGKLLRSYSTGDWLVRPGEDFERFTLRLPEEVKIRLVSSSLSRTKSCLAFPRASSWRKGYRTSSGGTGRGRNFFFERFDRDGRPDRWGFTVTPPFFSRADSARSPKAVGSGGGGGEESNTAPKTLFKSVTSPLHRLFGGMESNKASVNGGERSFDRLRLDGQVLADW